MHLKTRISVVFVLGALSACGGTHPEPAAPAAGGEQTPTLVAEPAEPAQPPVEEPPPPPPEPKLPPATSVVSFKVKDFDAWKKAFDEGQAVRRAAGVLAHHVSRGVDDPKLVLVYLVGADKDKLVAFVDSPELAQAMKDAGVRGDREARVLTPVQTVPVTEATLPAVMVTYEVSDFDAWKKAFDEDAPARRQAGIVGESISRDASQPNIVVVYLQGPTLEPIKAYANSRDLRHKLRAAGVKGRLAMLFVQGAEWKVYE